MDNDCNEKSCCCCRDDSVSPWPVLLSLGAVVCSGISLWCRLADQPKTRRNTFFGLAFSTLLAVFLMLIGAEQDACCGCCEDEDEYRDYDDTDS